MQLLIIHGAVELTKIPRPLNYKQKEWMGSYRPILLVMGVPITYMANIIPMIKPQW